MQRRALNAERNIGFSATVSARALNVDGSSFSGFFHQTGINSPFHGNELTAGLRRLRMTFIRVVGEML